MVFVFEILAVWIQDGFIYLYFDYLFILQKKDTLVIT